MPIPKQLAHKYIPNLGDVFEVGLVNVGVTVVTATIGANTALTDAQLIAAPPNTAVHNAYGPVVHSLGTEPKAVIAMQEVTGGDVAGIGINQVQYAFMTADNSAVYFRANSFTGTIPSGVSTRFIVIR